VVHSDLSLEIGSLLLSIVFYKELWLFTNGFIYPVVLFRPGVRNRRFVIFLWVYSALRLEISGLLLAFYPVNVFRAEVGDQ
jgi:hypothetical protein